MARPRKCQVLVWADTIANAKELKANHIVNHEGNGILVGASKQ